MYYVRPTLGLRSEASPAPAADLVDNYIDTRMRLQHVRNLCNNNEN